MRALFVVAAVGLLPAVAIAQDTLDPDVADELLLDPLISGLDAPTAAEFLPDGRLVIIEQFGDIKLWDGQSTPRTIGTINVQTGFERGLLGLAIDPQFQSSRRLYIYYSQDGAQKAGWVTLDATTDEVAGPPTAILEGMGAGRNHNGGGIVFGPDGHLYIGVGDTGCNCSCAPGQNNRNYFPTCLSNLQGKILRIDRDGNVPSTNPLTGNIQVPQCTGTDCRSGGDQFPSTTGPAATEIYNWGFRNPWRFAFDEQTGFLWIGDVGEISWEEVTVSTAPGQHHGWPFREGANGQAVSECADTTPTSGDCREPAFEYPRSEAPNGSQASITGGVFSNDCRWPEPWRGQYWFGDFVKARVWTLTPNTARDGVQGERTVVVVGAGGPVHFFNGPDGGVYYVAASGGSIFRIRPANPIDCVPMDAGVDDTGASVMDATTNSPNDAGMTGDAEDPEEDEGCGCSAVQVNPNDTPLPMLGLLLFVVAAMRWRHRD